MAQKTNSQQMNPSKTTDANGWTVTDLGTRKVYTRKYLWTGSQSMPQYSNFSLPSIPLPSGISTRAGIVANFQARCNDRTFIVNERVTDTATNFSIEVSEWHFATLTLTYVYVDLIAYDA